MGMDEEQGPPKDVQGEPWPPASCPVARIARYGGTHFSPFNDALVELGAYLKEHGYFEAHLITPVTDSKRHPVGEVVLCRLEELEPLNEYATAYIAAWTEQDVTMYSEDVYDLRDDLDKLKIAITAEAVAAWTPAQRAKVRAYAGAALMKTGTATALPPLPEELR